MAGSLTKEWEIFPRTRLSSCSQPQLVLKFSHNYFQVQLLQTTCHMNLHCVWSHTRYQQYKPQLEAGRKFCPVSRPDSTRRFWHWHGERPDPNQSWQWVTFYDLRPTWSISQLTRDPRDPWPAYPMTDDYSWVTVTVWRLCNLGRGKEVSMRFLFHTVPTPSPLRAQ